MSWPNLTIRLKQRVVDLLDYESRCNLRLSSKDNRDAVDSTKLKFQTLKIKEIPSKMSPGKTIIRCDMDTLTVWLIGKKNLTRIDRGWNGEIVEGLSETRQENRYEILNRFLISITNKGVIEAESVEIEGVRFNPPESWKPKCENFKITNFVTQNEHFPEWVRMTLETSRIIKKLDIQGDGYYGDFGEMIRGIRVTKSLRLAYDTVITDEDLDAIEAMDLRVGSRSISPEAAARRLQKFLKFGKINDVLEIYLPQPENFDARESFFPKSWTLRKIQKDEEEEGEFFGKILGGFENVHGVRTPREIDCTFFGFTMRLYCKIWENSTVPCVLYPFK